MTDPFNGLREDDVPEAPDPRFAADLRARLERALLAPGGADMTAAQTAPEPAVADPAAVPLPTLLPYLSVHDAAAALDFYVDAFGARRRGEPYVMPDGRIGHAELLLGDSAVLMLADESVPSGHLSPLSVGGSPVMLYLVAADVDAVVARATNLGATVTRPAADYEHGRNAVLVDPYGHRWMIAAPPAATEPARIRQGDLAYGSLWLPDAQRAKDFYGSALGWRFAPGGDEHLGNVLGMDPHVGLAGGVSEPTFFCCLAVDDLDAALARVRDAGGAAGQPTDESYGRVADCTDDQGMRFALYQLPAGAAGEGRRDAADVAYLTIWTPDSASFRAFFSAVLGWQFSAGGSEDGWQVQSTSGEPTRPMIGMHGGAERPLVEPMYVLPDVEAAIVSIRAAGGTAGDVEAQPYGRSVTCRDDQGTRFYLLES